MALVRQGRCWNSEKKPQRKPITNFTLAILVGESLSKLLKPQLFHQLCSTTLQPFEPPPPLSLHAAAQGLFYFSFLKWWGPFHLPIVPFFFPYTGSNFTSHRSFDPAKKKKKNGKEGANKVHQGWSKKKKRADKACGLSCSLPPTS